MIPLILTLLGLGAGFGGLAYGYFVLGKIDRRRARWDRLGFIHGAEAARMVLEAKAKIHLCDPITIYPPESDWFVDES